MHIHPPKPLHGWREFMGEVGIIVLGILIALAAEQAIEWAHWREKVAQANDALRTSIMANAMWGIEQQVTGGCIDRQLADAEGRLMAPGPYHPAPRFVDGAAVPFTVRAPSRDWGDGTWRIVTGEGVSTHLPDERRRLMDDIYNTLDQMRGFGLDAEQLNWRLNTLALPVAAEPAERARLIETIEEMRGREALMTLVAGQLLGHVRTAGLMPDAPAIRSEVYDRSGTVAFCREHGLPLAAIKPLDD